MQLQWVLIVIFQNSSMVPIATFDAYEACAEVRASYLAIKKDSDPMRKYFFTAFENRPSDAKCLPVGSEAQVREYIAQHPENAVTAPKVPKSQPPSNQ